MNNLGRGENKSDKHANEILTKETVGMVLVLFSLLLLVILITGKLIFGSFGLAIASFMFGMFGYAAYVLAVALTAVGAMLVLGKTVKIGAARIAYATLAFVFFVCLIHTITTSSFAFNGYGAYIAACYSSATVGIGGSTGGGVLFAIVVYPIAKLTTNIGGYIIFSILTAVCLYLVVSSNHKKINSYVDKPRSQTKKTNQPQSGAGYVSGVDASSLEVKPYPVPVEFSDMQIKEAAAPSLRLYCRGDTFELKTKREIKTEKKLAERDETIGAMTMPSAEEAHGTDGRSVLYPKGYDAAHDFASNLIFDKNSEFNTRQRTAPDADNFRGNFTSERSVKEIGQEKKPDTYSESFLQDIDADKEPNRPIKIVQDRAKATPSSSFGTDAPFSVNDGYDHYYRKSEPSLDDTVSSSRSGQIPAVRRPFERRASDEPKATASSTEDVTFSANTFDEPKLDDTVIDVNERSDGFGFKHDDIPESSVEDELGDNYKLKLDDEPSLQEPQKKSDDDIMRLSRTRAVFGAPEKVQKEVKREPEQPTRHVYKKYAYPPLSLYDTYETGVTLDYSQHDFNKKCILDVLRNFKIEAEISKVTQGPTVTRYDVKIPGNIAANRVFALDKELAMALRSKDGINIVPNYQGGAVAIEVPNAKRTKIGLKSLFSSEKFVNANPDSLMFAIGSDIENNPVIADVKKVKHMLVAGATGSGKSVFLNALILSLITRYSPEDVRLILIDPKQVEFNIYNNLPHLMINEIIDNNITKVLNILNWAIQEMDRRYSKFKQMSMSGTLVKDIDGYNRALDLSKENKMPKIVIIIDELADLIAVAKNDIDARIQRLAALARASGIYLVFATQHPSAEVVTGVIKSNLTARFCFKVAAEVYSRIIINQSGGEKLLGSGDLLYVTDSMGSPVRVQAAYTTEEEIQRVVDYVKKHNECYFESDIVEYLRGKAAGDDDNDEGEANIEPVYINALRYVIEVGQASISMIQRKFTVGYSKAGKIIDWMENLGYISAFEGSKSRKILISKDEFISKYGDV